jgi:hypothetical protein
MTFDEIEEAVLSSDSDDWHQIHDGAGYERYVFKPYPDIVLTVGRQQAEEGRSERIFHQAWARKHPDTSSANLDVEIEYRGSVIDVWHCVSVDGGRALIPYPECVNTFEEKVHGEAEEGWGWMLDAKAFRRGEIIGSIYADRFREYVRRSRLGVEGRLDEFPIGRFDTYSGDPEPQETSD